MTRATHQLQRGTDWYEEICQQLDELRDSAKNYATSDEVVPEPAFFDFVKQKIQDLRQLADFPKLSVPDVWLGPEGDVGLTWDCGERSFDLVFGKEKLTARLTVDLKQELIETKDVPYVLAQLAA